MSEANDIAALARAGEKAPQVVRDDESGRKWLIIPAGYSGSTEVSDEHNGKLKPPLRISEKVMLYDKQSFVDYVNIYKTPSTIVVCDPNNSNFVAKLDYHAPSAPAFVSHRTQLKLQFTEEWQRWTGIDKQLKSQEEFARFIEENAVDVTRPAGADLLELARDMSATKTSNFKRAIRAQNGDTQFEYDEVTTAKGGKSLDVPTDFTVSIPIYLNEKYVNIKAFLRYRLNEGKLLLGIELHRLVFVRQAVLTEMAVDIREKTGCVVLVGSNGPSGE